LDNLLDSKEFIKNAKNSDEWYRLAFGLKYSASILNKKWGKLFDKYYRYVEKYGEDDDKTIHVFMDLINIERTYYLLMALAIENIIKGKLLEHNPDKVHFIAKIDPLTEKILEPLRIDYGWGHNLTDLVKQLCKVSEFTITKKQEKVLDYLGEILLWGGRYPAPVSVKVKSKDPFMDLTGKNREVVVELFNKLSDLL